MLEERARAAGLRLAEWVREALLAAPVEPGMGSGVDSGEDALAEVLALRSLLLNLHFRAAKGEPVGRGGDARPDRAGRRSENAAGAGAHGVSSDGGAGDRAEAEAGAGNGI